MDDTLVRLPPEWMRDHLRSLALGQMRSRRGRPGHYGHDNVAGNEVGLKGEAAALLWFDRHGFRLNSFEDPSDVLAGRPGPPWIRVEVKTWSRRWWPTLGRTVAATQFPHVVDRDWLVLWTVDEGVDPDGAGRMRLDGWTSTADLLAHGVAEWTAGVHANVRVRGTWIRPMADLAVLDPTAFHLPDRTPPAVARCDHPQLFGKCWGCAPPPRGTRLPDRVVVHDGRYHLPAPSPSHPACGTAAETTVVPDYRPLLQAALRHPACRDCFPLV